MNKIFLSTSALVFIASIAQAQVSIITGITSTPAFSSPETDNVVLNTFTTASGTYNYDFSVSSFNGTGQIAWGTDGVQPVSTEAAITDNSPITGTLSTQTSGVYGFGQTLTGTDTLFVIFNATNTSPGFFDYNADVTALDSGGVQVGSVINIPTFTIADAFGTADLNRDGSTPLNARGLFGWAVDISDFGGDASTIASIRLGASQNGVSNVVDIQQVGIGVIPEPSTYAMIAGVLFLGMALIRRRQC
ncbi:PEP-CTERM sorting domain-containing protein [Rubellicoccus peritrichatus]|uniref:PEP-CTERM sorting domain-containing protein n=1 Tax=Rubellicoccus peritrichatus TaxID=3080537 RepID=A0AAQ3LDF5_9BACT|nr:PEP-CTERM sorting domain-containing protein [Puniceicoccus sp. CR14]WOO43701.1 PEP-CTERM sorting domain-containing protein [Puniceicoccus sp. CR14]